jgi:hypothetical protein
LQTISGSGVFENFEELLLHGNGRMSNIDDDFIFEVSRPKEIEIQCPGPVAPIVTIRDLDSELAGSGSCMILRLTGANFNMKLELNCDEDEKTNVE